MGKAITIGVAGHVDHGKTSLVRTLTGIDTDRLKEEKERGLSIQPGIAPLSLPDGESVALVDVPGHRDFLKNTIRGLSAVDLGVLVVACDDGVMPQTLDHLEVLQCFQAQGGLIVLSKTDLVDQETVALAEMEIRERVRGTFLEGKPVIPFSSVSGQGKEDILNALCGERKNIPGKKGDGPFHLWIDQTRTFPGFGTVVSGTVYSGSLRTEEALQIFPSGKRTKARFLEVHHQRVPKVSAGQRVGINVHKTSKEDALPGMLLVSPGTVETYLFFNAELKWLSKAETPLENRQRLKLYLGTTVRQVMVVLMQGDRLLPGETALVQLRLTEPLAALPQDPFVLAPLNRNAVVGGGRILVGTREKFRRVKATKTVSYLELLQRGDGKTFIGLYLEKCLNRSVRVEELARILALPEEAVQGELNRRVQEGVLIRLPQQGYFPKARLESLKKEVMETLRKSFAADPFKLSMTPEEIRARAAPTLEDAPFQELLASLLRERKLVLEDGRYRLPDPPGKLSERQERMISRLLEYARNLGLTSFSAGYFCKIQGERFEQKEVQKLLDHLYAQKRLVRLNDNRFLTPEALEEIKRRVRQVIQSQGRFTLQDIKGVFGYGRTHGIPVLEHLDTIGFTRRIGDVRVLVEKSTEGKEKG